MNYIKTPQQIQLVRNSAKVLLAVQQLLKKHIHPGITLLELDALAEDFILSSGGIPSFKNFPGEKSPFPGTLCTMINSEVVHGIPDSRALQLGDLLSVDCGVFLEGFHSDAAFSLVVGGEAANPERFAFEQTVKRALEKGCKACRHGERLGTVGAEISEEVLAAGYSICEEYTGHGLGEELHEEPSVYNYGTRGKGEKLKSGMILAIEPIVAMGNPKTKTLKDGWTVVTVDGKDACQWEHCGVVTENGLEIFV